MPDANVLTIAEGGADRVNSETYPLLGVTPLSVNGSGTPGASPPILTVARDSFALWNISS